MLPALHQVDVRRRPPHRAAPPVGRPRAGRSTATTCPRIVEVDGRAGVALRGRAHLHPDGLVPAAARAPDEAGYPPAPGTARFDEIRPGCYDPVARLDDMDVDGVWGQLCFPNYARFAGHRFFLERAGPRARARVPPHLQRLPARRVVRDRSATASSAPRSCRSHDIDAGGRRARARDRQGRQRHRVLGEPDRARAPVGAHRPLGSALGGGRRGGHPALHAHRQLVARS